MNNPPTLAELNDRLQEIEKLLKAFDLSETSLSFGVSSGHPANCLFRERSEINLQIASIERDARKRENAMITSQLLLKDRP